MNPVAVDFETVADKRLIPFMKTPMPDKRLKNEDKIREQIEEKRAVQIADMAKKPVYNKIICAGFYDGISPKALILPHDGDMQVFLKSIWDHLKKHDYYITFNGLSFDFPTLIMDSLMNQVKQPIRIGLERFRISNHFDIRAVLGGWDKYAEGSLDFYMKAFGLPGGKQGVNGSMIAGLYADKEYDIIADYCSNGDCVDTWNLWKYVTEYIII